MAKLLLVDDDESVREEFSIYLRRKGYDVVAKADALAALRSFRSDEPDIVLTDYMMPEINGVELLKELKALNPKVPVVLMSGAADMRTTVEALKQDAFDFLKKPVDSRELLKTLQAALARAKESLAPRSTEDDVRAVGPLTHKLVGPQKDLSLVQVGGPLDERTQRRIDDAFRKMLDQDVIGKRVAISCVNVTYINNVGLNMLVEVHKNLINRGREVVFTQLSDKMYQYVKMLGYLDHFRVTQNLNESLERLVDGD